MERQIVKTTEGGTTGEWIEWMSNSRGYGDSNLQLAALQISFLTAMGLLYLLFSFRRRLPYRVNCWFCNFNCWVPYRCNNSWTCSKCLQYNGFNPDGSYNIVQDTRTTNSIYYNSNRLHISSIENENGLCRMCNMNQRLKIMQLANFVPMNEKKYDSEIDAFKLHLEKVYKLCSACRNYLKYKLSLEKRLHLDTKLSNQRLKPKDIEFKKNISETFKRVLDSSLKFFTIVLLLSILYDIAINLDQFLARSVIHSTKKHFRDIYIGITNISLSYNNTSKPFQYASDILAIFPMLSFDKISTLAQIYRVNDMIDYVKMLYRQYFYLSPIITVFSMVGFILQILVHSYDFNLSYRHLFNDIVWGVVVYNALTGIKSLHILQACFIVVLLMNYPTNKSKDKKEEKFTKTRLKNLSDNSQINSDDDSCDNDSDSDESLGIKSVFQPRPSSRTYYNRFSKPEHYSKKKSKPSESIFSGMSSKSYYFKKLDNYPKTKNWDVDLNQSISDLNLGCDINKDDVNSVFSSSINYNNNSLFMPAPSLIGLRPILSPSRLSSGTHQSWVAGGYWGADNPRLSQNVHETSSSSSQSSGFESLTSNIRHRNSKTFPPSREGSIPSDYEKRNDNLTFCKNAFNPFSLPANFSTFQSHSAKPIFPVMKLNESINIPQANVKSHSSRLSTFSASQPDYTFIPLQKSGFS